MNLTQEQTDAVAADGLVILSACPGSGKTVVVAHRIKRIIDSGVLKPYQGVMASSFTRIARDSLLDSFRDINGANVAAPHFIGTLDSFVFKYIFQPFSHKLSRNGQPITVLELDSRWLTEDVFPRLQSEGIEAERIIYRADGSCKYSGRNIAVDRLNQIKRATRDRNIATQSDVTYYSLELLRGHPEISRALTTRFPYMIVDEAQDCSDVQMAIIDLLVANGHGEIMLSGDPYQSIYEWRDAVPALFIEKTSNPDWTSLRLSYSQRSGPNICNFLSKFHPQSPITSDPLQTSLASAEVIFIETMEPTQALDAFIVAAERLGIDIHPDNLGVLYRTRTSQMNLKAGSDEMPPWWATTCNRINIYKHFEFPLQAAYGMMNKDYALAYRFAERFFYFQFYKESLGTNKERSKFLTTIEAKRILWSFCKQLPDVNLALDDWIESFNSLLTITFAALFPLTGLPDTAVQLPLRKRRGFGDNPVISDVISVANPVSQEVTFEHIHQIKGRTFEAVLIYVDSDHRRWMSSNVIKNILRTQEMFTGRDAEHGRCFYVGASRARKLLCIVTEDQELITLLQG